MFHLLSRLSEKEAHRIACSFKLTAEMVVLQPYSGTIDITVDPRLGAPH